MLTKRGKKTRIAGSEAVRSLIEEMLRRPPSTPIELQERIAAFDLTSVRREIIGTLLDRKLSAEEEFLLMRWLVEIKVGNGAIALLECLSDAGRTPAKRALAVIILSDKHEERLHERMSMLGSAQQVEIMDAAHRWLLALQERSDTSSRTSRPIRRRGASGTKRAVSQVCRLKITMREIKPAIWRRIEVREDVTLAKLHQVLQIAFGWTDSHLHEFQVAKRRYGVPDQEWPDDTISEKKVTLRSLIDEGVKRFVYEYDFGDDWRHNVVIERIGEPETGVEYPRCTGGKRACPPEDCGGPWGYAELLATLEDPSHPDHDQMRGWAGEIDPERFDLDEVNRELRRLR